MAAGEHVEAGVQKSAAEVGGERTGDAGAETTGRVHPDRGGNRDAGPGRADYTRPRVADGDPGSFHGLGFPGAAAA